MKKIIIAAMLAGSFGAIQGAAQAQTIIVRDAPPALRHEVVPSPRHGYDWAPGHWEYRHHRYVWVRGHWVRERHGYRYRSPVWEQRDGHWVMRAGGWERGRHDRDGDGIPNRFDRDRDGDGVPNRFDDHPNNPRRR